MNIDPAAGTEYDSDDSEYDSEDQEEEDINPFGTRTTKERIRRRGLFPLNLTSNYGRKSGWGVREGIRELLQNLYPLLLPGMDNTRWLILVLTMSVRMTTVRRGKWIGFWNRRMEEEYKRISPMRKGLVPDSIHRQNCTTDRKRWGISSIDAICAGSFWSTGTPVFHGEYGQWAKHPRGGASTILVVTVLSILYTALTICR